jgi:hypothetical protein
VLVCLAAAPASQPTTRPAKPPKPAKDVEARAADGAEFPVVSVRPFPGKPTRLTSLHDAYQIIGRPPAWLPTKVYSATESRTMLRSRFYRMGDNGPAVHTWFYWFALNVAKADVAGFGVHDGIINELFLFYPNPTTADRMLADEYPTRDSGSPWNRVVVGHGVALIAQLTEAARYLAEHPDLSADVRRAIASHDVALGMTFHEAVLALGNPRSVVNVGNTQVVQWRILRVLTTVTFGEDDKAKSISR